MRMKGLECLVAILKCMVEWTKEIKEILHQRNKGYNDFAILAEIPPLFYDWLRSLNLRKRFFNHLGCKEGNVGLKDIYFLHSMPHYLFLYYKIFFIKDLYICPNTQSNLASDHKRDNKQTEKLRPTGSTSDFNPLATGTQIDILID